MINSPRTFTADHPKLSVGDDLSFASSQSYRIFELNNTMIQRYLFLFAAFLSCYCLAPLQAQTRVQLSVPDVVAGANQPEICVPVIADSFPNIAAVQFSLAWDAAQVAFTEVKFGANPLSLSDMTTSMPVADNFGVTFTTNDLRGITLTPGTVLFELCFSPTMTEGSTPITFDGFLPGEFVQEGTIVAFPQTLIPGSIAYGNNVTTSVLPGDTNDDGQADYLDLLNIGLLHGTSGPARQNAAVQFTQQTAQLWPGTLLSGLNQAKVDCDGDGSITAADLSVVQTNYGMATGTYQLNEGSTANQGPALTLVGGPLNAGETSTLTLMLGSGNDPLAVGYALACYLEFNPAQIDVNSLTVDFSNSFLGNDLLTSGRVSPAADGRLEIALSRKDQLNTTNPGGEVCRISFIPLNNADGSSYDLNVQVTPNTFLLADQSVAPVQGSTASVTVQGTVATREPAWAQDLRIYPNPYTYGPLSISGQLPNLNRISVIDASGRSVLRFAGSARALDLSALPAGSYLLQLEASGETVVRKFIRQ